MAKRQSTKVPCVCETCGKPFETWHSNLKYGRGRFCSKPCQNTWQTIPLVTRFFQYAGKVTFMGCVLWTGAINGDGYGVISESGQQGKMLLAHRFAYTLQHGPIPDEIKVLHRCDNPSCVAIDHLFLGTQADNIHDMVAKGRARKRIRGSRRYLQDLRRA